MHNIITIIVCILDAFVLTYMMIFFLINIFFVVLSFRRIQKDLRVELLRPASISADMAFLPSVSLLVPAYNEEVTIVESIRSLLRLEYSSYEIIICNDGSKDRTVEVLRRAFQFVRTEIEMGGNFITENVRSVYEARCELPSGLKRLILIDKENGGKADALNSAINFAHGDFVTSMDADSLLQPDALLYLVRPILDDPHGMVAVGAQVGLSNGATVQQGRVVEVSVPKKWIARFQVVEYMRSFAQGRVALSALNSLLILSGVLALIRRDLALAIGGFLTKRMHSRVGVEYCGAGAHTVCEDMEIVVRLHRYLLDRNVPGKAIVLPFPMAWTEAPEVYKDLGKQRARWYRGLLEVMVYHRKMFFRRKFRQIGMFSLPYQVVFEALAPILEFLGYVMLVFTLALGIISLKALVIFVFLATTINVCLSTFAVFMSVYSERATRSHTRTLSLFPYARIQDVALLLLSGFFSNFGYRQYLVYWQMKGFIDFLKRKKGWDKFARKGFVTKT